MSRRLLLTLFLLLFVPPLLPGRSRAADAPPAAQPPSPVEAVWRRFTSALRRGDYATAHAQFSAESRKALSYGEFVEEYSPLSPARELVLAPAERATSRLEENWAELIFEGAMPATGRGFRVGVSLVRNGRDWGVVAARNEQAERVEALVRRALGRMTGANEADFAARAAEVAAAEPALQFYRLRLIGGVAVAEALTPGLRAFHLGADGVVGEGLRPARTPEPEADARTTQAQAAQSASAQPGELPELSEPPPPRRLPPMPDEPAEPPMPGAGGGSGGGLPDQID